jgi:hypothetical protein
VSTVCLWSETPRDDLVDLRNLGADAMFTRRVTERSGSLEILEPEDFLQDVFHFYEPLSIPKTRHKRTEREALKRTGGFSNGQRRESREALKRLGSGDEGEDIQ